MLTRLLCLASLALLVDAATVPAFVQINAATPQTAQSSVSVTYLKAQSAGNLNAIAVGWNDSVATVRSVTDTKGNLYTLATGPATVSGQISQSLYYAKNIAAAAVGANVVTVTFSAAAVAPDIRVLEYSGLDPTVPLDVVAPAGTGTNAAPATGSVSVPTATDLLFAAEITTGTTTKSGTGFTSRIITSPDADIAEDRILTAAGSYTATATLAGSSAWIIQMVAFKTATTVTPPPPTTYSITVPITGLANGTYPLAAPVIPGYTVTPTSQTVTVNNANATAIPFVALVVVATSHSVSLSWGAGAIQPPTGGWGPSCTIGTAGCHAIPTVAGYNILRSSTSGGPYTQQLNSSLLTGTNFNDTTVGAGQTLYYVVQTVNTLGDVSVNSNQAVAMIPTP